ncbi:extracellular solute-binding protein [Cohnella hashimotonis]|uniref:Extracellular solute-binding protein n=1 Tax=Cohnella hashimotonis TaxID=2826895 RepID=A0ABT6TF14_9BACL|nr:extracellular solute-binding protein [Cohnella hashimotonis]MDI4645151.1 extracellular solute-binding protein [Cohnella hashimotonis]
MLKRKRLLMPALALTLLTTTLTACGGNDNETGSSGSAPASAGSTSSNATKANPGSEGKPLSLSMMNIFYSTEPPKQDNEILKKIEEYTNTDLDITWVPSTAYEDKLNVTVASGQLPQTLLVTNNKLTSIVNSIRSGMFWEVGPYLKDYPNLSQMNEKVLDNISIDGKVYGIYRYRALARYGVIIRKDWLDRLGLKEPTTVDELYKVAKAFTQNDPDGNGKNDTYGVAEEKSIGILNQFALYLGAPNNWGEKDGKLQPAFMYPEYKQALQLVKKMYDEKLITQDFAVANRADQINQQKAGIYFSVIDDAAYKHEDLYKLNSSANIDILQPITGPLGTRVLATTGYNGTFMFPKTSVKSEEELKRILGFFDKLADEPMQNLLGWGIEGKHYTLSNDKPVRTEEQTQLDSSEINPLRQLVWDDGAKKMSGENPPIVQKFSDLLKANEQYAITDQANPYLSDTQTEKGSELVKIIDEAKTKYIMGAIDDKGWDSAVQNWLNGGGQKIIEEYTAAYQSSKK